MKQNENKIKEEKKLEKVTGGTKKCAFFPLEGFLAPYNKLTTFCEGNKQNNEKPTVGEKNRKIAK